MVSNGTDASGFGKAFDRLAGDRIRHGIDWRARRAVQTELTGAKGAETLARALRSEAGEQAIRAEVARQLGGQTSPAAVAADKKIAERDFTLSVLLGSKTPVRRTMTPGQYKRLSTEITALTGISETVDMRITQAFRSLLDAEARGLGRIAGGPCNILGKLVTPQLLDLPDGDVLEIGTLHGLFAPTLLRSLRRTARFRKLTVVDPFTGHQMQGGANIATDPGLTPVVEDVARWNFSELGLGEDEVRIINGFSTDADIQAQAGDRKYAVVVVDGDHFEPGVAKDLRWVENILVPGGIAILDDYGDKHWPGVQQATDEYLADPAAKMTMLGAVWTSGFLQLPVTS